MPAQALASGWAKRIGHAADFGKECEQFFAGFAADSVQTGVSGKEVFGWCIFGKDNFMFVEHDVDIGDLVHGVSDNGAVVDQVFGGGKNFVLAKDQLGLPPIAKHAVLRRYDQVACVVKGA